MSGYGKAIVACVLVVSVVALADAAFDPQLKSILYALTISIMAGTVIFAQLTIRELERD